MNKIYTATVKNNLLASSSSNGSGEKATLYSGDMISVIDANNGYYYIIEYNTINDSAKTILQNTTNYIVGKWISKSAASLSGLQTSDSGLETDFSKLKSKGESRRSMDGPNNSATESLYASYSVTPRTEAGRMRSSPKVALDERRNTYDYTIDRITRKNDYTYIVDNVEYMTGLEYINTSTDTSSLPIKSLFGILGIPHQFTAITDPRIVADDRLNNEHLGRVYATNIIKTIPLLLVTPGVPHFAVKKSSGITTSISSFFGEMSRSVLGSDSQNVGITGDTRDYHGKYYSLEFQYAEYYKYVDIMLKAAAHFLGLSKEPFNDIDLGDIHWRSFNSGLFTSTGSFSLTVLTALNNLFTGLTGRGDFNKNNSFSDCIAFYANCGENVTDNFGTSVTQSSLASSLNSVSDITREAQFVLGGMFNATSTGLTNTVFGSAEGKIRELAGGNIVSNLLAKAQTLLAGGRLVFPEIWQDSDFGRTYNVSMKLVSPSADKLSIFFCLLVPLYHVLALILPRQSVGNGNTPDQGYISPFLLRIYYKGKFNIDMGIATSLSVVRGAEAEWSKDGLPTVLELQMGVKDLYTKYFMTDNKFLIFSNITELDYIANTCGININTSEASRAYVLWKAINGDGIISDYIDNVFLRLQQLVNNNLNRLFGYM